MTKTILPGILCNINVSEKDKQLITLEDAGDIARLMAANTEASDVQILQTHFRMQLVAEWQIPQGAKVLEIGCGQGDMTAALARAVGSEGHVMAIDSASPEYGAPVSLGRSAEHLKSTPLGQQITFHFQYDLLDLANDFAPDTFDYAVLAHSSWYFASLDQLRRLFLRIRPWARRLCYSEWDIEPHTHDQIAHMLAILIQGQVEVFKTESASNVRTPFSRTKLKLLLQETGWRLSTESTIDSTLLQDAHWEIDHCLNSSLNEAAALNLPSKFQELLASQVDTLRQIADRNKNRSLSSFSIVAEKT